MKRKLLIFSFVLYFLVFVCSDKGNQPWKQHNWDDDFSDPFNLGYALRFNGQNEYVELPHLLIPSRVSFDFYVRYRVSIFFSFFFFSKIF